MAATFLCDEPIRLTLLAVFVPRLLRLVSAREDVVRSELVVSDACHTSQQVLSAAAVPSSTIGSRADVYLGLLNTSGVGAKRMARSLFVCQISEGVRVDGLWVAEVTSAIRVIGENGQLPCDT